MVKIDFSKLDVSNRTLYTIIALGMLIALGVGVYAVVPNPGHTASEIDFSGGVNGNAIFNNLVGIGTTTPASALDVIGWTRSQGIRTNTLQVDNQICIGSTCKTSWTNTNELYGAAPNGNDLKMIGMEELGLTASKVTVAANHFVWQTVTNTNSNNKGPGCDSSYALCRAGDIAGQTYYVDGISPVYTEQIQLDLTKGAVAGIRLVGSTSDDNGICVAGVPGYFFVAATRGENCVDSGRLKSLNINDGSYSEDLLLSATMEPKAGALLDKSNFILDNLPSGDYGYRYQLESDLVGCTNKGGVYYVKATGVDYIPPGKILIVKGQYENAGATTSIKCKVQVVYASQLT